MRSAPRVPRSPLVGLIVATFALLAAGRASAQYGGTSGTGTGGVTGTTGSLAATDFTILFNGYFDGKWVQMNSTTQQYYFNQARCLCDTDPNGEFEVIVQPGAGAGAKIQGQLENSLTGGGQGASYLFAGAQGYDCLNPTAYAGGLGTFCTNLIDPGSGYKGTLFSTMAAFGNVNYIPSGPIPVAYLFNSLSNPTCGSNGTCHSPAACKTTSTQTNLQLWIQTNSGVTPDFDSSPPAPVSLVGYVPVTPANVAAEGGNEALKVSWDWGGVNIATDTTLSGVQIFCRRGATDQVFPTGSFGAAYQTPATLCPNNVAAVAAASTDGPFSNLDPKYLCSGLIPAVSNSYRITGLQNGIQYGVGVAAVDRYGNIGAIANVVYGVPIPTVDFYAEYKDDGGSGQGGFCALVSQHARPGVLTVLCLAALGLVLHLRRRSRRRRRPGAGTLAVLLVAGTLTSAQAHAQVGYGGTSFVDDGADEAWEGSPREYAIEARFGLYTPNVDSEFGKGNTPQASVFGSKKRPMWQFEFDWEFLQEFGTLALGGVLGYYKENALACKQSGLQADGSCNDRSGDNTGLRLIPLAALLVYRMDEAAKRWNIPLVPYAKIGLNYTIWTITNGNGDVAWYQDAKGQSTKGQGGTMGWQAAVGISLQLDFLDPSSARGFDADSGVNHTYAFFELDHVDGSGLYRKDVLRVGDDTWFAGLMFEF